MALQILRDYYAAGSDEALIQQPEVRRDPLACCVNSSIVSRNASSSVRRILFRWCLIRSVCIGRPY